MLRHRYFIYFLTWGCIVSFVAFHTGCADKEKAQLEKKAEHLESARQYMAKAEFPEAVIELKNAIQLAPQDEDVHYELGIVKMKMEKNKDAFLSFYRAASINPNNLKTRLKLGEISLLMKYTQYARVQAELLLKRVPQNLQALTLLSDIQILEKNIGSAIETLEEIASIYPDNVKTQCTLGQLYLAKGEFDQADKANMKAAVLDPSMKKLMIPESAISNARYRSIPVLARYYETTGKWHQAEKMYLTSLAVNEDKVSLLKNLAGFYSRTKAYEKALHVLNRAYSMGGELYTLMLIARLHLDFGRIKDAETIADDVLNRMVNPDAMMLKGRIHLLRKEYGSALEQFDRVIKGSPRNTHAHYYRGTSLAADGNINKALQAFEKAVELNPSFLNARLKLAELYLLYSEINKLSLAQQQLEAVLKQAPNHPEALMLQAGVKVRSEDLKGAEAAFREVVRLYPKFSTGHFKLGVFYYQIKQQKKALQSFRKAIAVDPLQIRALTYIIYIHLKGKAFNKALKLCREHEKKIGNNPYFAAIMENLKGRIFAVKGDFDKARKHFETSVKEDLNNLSSHMALAQLYLRDKDVNKVISHFEDMLEKNPKLLPGYMILGITYDRQGEKEKAESYYRKALEIKSDFAPAANNLAWSLAERGSNLDEAFQLARVAIDRLPEDPYVLDTLGIVYHRMGYFGKAVLELQKSVSFLPGNPLHTYHLAKAYYDNDQIEQGNEYFRKALKLNPDFKGAEDARRSLKEHRSVDG